MPTIHIDQRETVCATCKHFYQHYTLDKQNQFIAVYCGHCSNPFSREKKPGQTACYRYEPKGREG